MRFTKAPSGAVKIDGIDDSLTVTVRATNQDFRGITNSAHKMSHDDEDATQNEFVAYDEPIPRDDKGNIVSGCAFLYPVVITQELLEVVARDQTIIGVLLKDSSGMFQAGTQVTLLKKDRWHLDADEMLLSRLLLFGNYRAQ